MSKSKIKFLDTKRFVLRKSLIGKGEIIRFTNKAGKVYVYDHDIVYKANEAKLKAMNCWDKYGSYTATHSVPSWSKEYVK